MPPTATQHGRKGKVKNEGNTGGGGIYQDALHFPLSLPREGDWEGGVTTPRGPFKTIRKSHFITRNGGNGVLKKLLSLELTEKARIIDKGALGVGGW